jgi:heme O synthase-like polyprenyltransferase
MPANQNHEFTPWITLDVLLAVVFLVFGCLMVRWIFCYPFVTILLLLGSIFAAVLYLSWSERRERRNRRNYRI